MRKGWRTGAIAGALLGAMAAGAARAELTLVEDEVDLPHIAGARFAAASADGAHVYVATATLDAIAIYARSGATGALTYLGSAVDDTSGVDGLAGVLAIALSPDGSSLYSFGPEGVGAFARNAGSGALTFLELETDDETTLFAAPSGGAVRATRRTRTCAARSIARSCTCERGSPATDSSRRRATCPSTSSRAARRCR